MIKTARYEDFHQDPYTDLSLIRMRHQKNHAFLHGFNYVCRKSPNRAVVLVAFVLNPLSAGGCPVPDFCKSSSQRHLRGPKTRTPEG